MKVGIRVDSSYEIGTGHVMRCMTLAKMISTKADVIFICRQLKGHIISIIQAHGFKVVELENCVKEQETYYTWYENNWEQDAKETERIIQNHNINWLIIDHYGIDYKWEQALYHCVKRVIVIDDLANRKHHCHVILDQNYYLDLDTRYDRLISPNCIKLLGPSYALIRDEFNLVREKIKERSGNVHRILVFFGGSDPTNETIKALKALESLNLNEIYVDVVVGNSNMEKEKIEQICSEHNLWTLHIQVDYMAKLMAQADLSIGAGGTTTWERCFLGLPSLIITVADNQVELTKAVDRIGVAINLGQSKDVLERDIASKVSLLLHNPDLLKKMSKKSLDLFTRKVEKGQLVKILLGE